MIPRNKLDIGWSDIAFGLAHCVLPAQIDAQQKLEQRWSPDGHALAMLSVRSGFDALLTELALPKGSEILLSAITIRDMVRIIEHHGLVAVPIDLDMATLKLKPDALQQAVTPRTRALLVAHLFGSRLDMSPYAEFARRHNLLLLEDCAQAFTGDDYRGHAQSDVTMFSFGTIKTATAMGGALLGFKDKSLAEKIRSRQASYPLQSRWAFSKKLLKNSLLQLLTAPLLFTLFAWLCKLVGTNHDKIISNSLRGFAGGELFTKIRQQPCYPLIALLERRISHYSQRSIEERVAIAHGVKGSFPQLEQPGQQAANHSHWVMPILSAAPDELVQHLWQHGFDATRGASSMMAVPLHGDNANSGDAANTMQHILYLPMHPAMKPAEIHRLAKALAAFQPA
jgi:perosamine synthetase